MWARAAYLLHEGLELTELIQQGFVGQVGNIFDVVVTGAVATSLLLGVAGVDTLQDAQTSIDEKKIDF